MTVFKRNRVAINPRHVLKIKDYDGRSTVHFVDGTSEPIDYPFEDVVSALCDVIMEAKD